MTHEHAEIIARELASLASLINHDQSVGSKDIQNLDSATKGLQVDIEGEKMTIEQIENDENVKIWLEIEKGNYSHCSRLTVLPAAIAKNLSKCEEGKLDLYGLSSISDEAIEYLSKYDGDLDLGGLITLSGHAVKCLGMHKGKLDLNSVTSLSEEKLIELYKNNGTISLYRLENRELSDWAAECLSNYKGDYLDLARISFLSEKSIEFLSRFKGGLDLSGLTELSVLSAKCLGKHVGRLLLNGLTSIPDEVVVELTNEGDIALGGLSELSDVAAECLSRHSASSLYVFGVTHLSDTAAQHLSNFKGDEISLTRLDNISDIGVAHLAKCDAYLSIESKEVNERIAKFKK